MPAMTPQSKNLYEVLLRIKNLPELAPFKAMLADEAALETRMMATLDDKKAMWRAQGAVRALTKLLDLIENSNKVLDKERLSSVGGKGFLTSSNSP